MAATRGFFFFFEIMLLLVVLCCKIKYKDIKLSHVWINNLIKHISCWRLLISFFYIKIKINSNCFHIGYSREVIDMS